jgi:hypothetical protein
MYRGLLRHAAGPLVLALGLLAACGTDSVPPLAPDALADRAGFDIPGAHRQYGTPVKLGDGKIRAYVVLSAWSGQAPLEVGIAMDARSLEGLSSTEPAVLTVPLPQQSPAPYTFAMVDWNPGGHEPPGIYDAPHFDFHFYTVPEEEVAAILPGDPDFAAEANDLPTGDHIPPFYTVLAPPGLMPADVAVPQMGVHWVDVRSPELQGMLGNPGDYQPFDVTFIYGSWNGRFTFLEPMITREFLLTQPDEVRAVSQPGAYPEPGWYPAAYRISYDAQAREYRIALTQLAWYD